MIERDTLINRTQMVTISREYNIFISQSTIHRWANEPDFPHPIGQDGKNLLYSLVEFVNFLKQRLRRIEEEH